MSVPHEQRCCALQAMFQFDLGGTVDLATDLAHVRESFEGRAREARSVDPIESECDFTLPAVAGGIALAEKAWSTREEADRSIEELAPEWPPHRQPNVDRNILRLGFWEIRHGSVPPAVALNEAVELAKAYSTEKSAAFVNGVLDRIAHPVVEATVGSVAPEPAAAVIDD